MHILISGFKPYISEKRKEEYMGYVKEILDSGQWAMGPFTERFEKEVAQAANMKYAVSASHANAALSLAFGYYKTVMRAEVAAFQALAFPSMYQAAKTAGLKVVPIESKEGRYYIDARQIKDRVDVVVPTDLFGYSYEDEEPGLAEKGIVVHDAAQAFGSITEWCRNDYVISLHTLKPLAAGEGGVLFTNDKGLADFAQIAKIAGMAGRRAHVYRALDTRMPELAAAFALSGLHEVQKTIEVYKSTVDRYNAYLDDMYENKIEMKRVHRNGVYAVLTVKNETEKRLLEHSLLNDYGINCVGTSGFYLPELPIWADETDRVLPIAQAQAYNHVILPSGARTEEEIDYVIKAVYAAKKKLQGDLSFDRKLWAWSRDRLIGVNER
jgi:dTDP-4-amino-4,6-dideoxygalactose transaminase